jgi:hypothetical protein
MSRRNIPKENYIHNRFQEEAYNILGLPRKLKFKISGNETSMLSTPSDSEQMMECIPGLRDEMHPLHVLDAFAGAGGNTIYFMCSI